MATSYPKLTIGDVENLGVSIVRKRLFEQPNLPVAPSDLPKLLGVLQHIVDPYK